MSRLRPRAMAPALAVALCAAPLVGTSSVAFAAEFLEVATPAAVLYDGPSDRARKIFIAPRGMPVEVVSTLNRWVKVRDQAGDVLWIERSDLAASRHVVANTLAAIRKAPRSSAELVVQVERGVLLEVVEPDDAAGWLRVRHRDGQGGFVDARDVWGR